MDPSDVSPEESATPSPRTRPRRARRGGEHLDERLHAIRDALRAARMGDLSVRLPTDGADGILWEVAQAFNALVEQDEVFVEELGRAAHVVGIGGETGERAEVGSLGGSWASALSSINGLIQNIAWRTAEVTRVLSGVAEGDLSGQMPLHIDGQALQGDFLHLGTTLNTAVDRLRAVSSGVSEVVHEIGVEGKLGAQSNVEGLPGTWRVLLDDVNRLSTNLAAQVRNIAVVSTALANGDLSQKVTVESRGEILELKDVINTTVDQLRSFTAEVIRVAREVGTEGKLGAQADVRGVSGVWQDLTNSVNRLAGNLTSQVRNIAQIATAIAKGDLSQKITVEAKGEIFELKDTINAMVEQLRAFAAEVTRVAEEVGTEGKLGGQADVEGVSGTWKDLTENVNILAGNLTSQVRGMAKVVTAVANGDLTQKLVLEARGEIAALANTINDMTDTLSTFADQVTTVAREVGMEGKLGGQARVPGASGTWRGLTDSVNMLAGNLTAQVRNIALVTTAVANGDLSKTITVEAKGEILELKDTVNSMVEQLRTFAAEVTRVAREVGTDGQLGGQARVPGVSGTWKDLTDNVNLMASNLTDQVRGISRVVTAVANGDLTKELGLVAKGEIAALADTINNMTDTLRTFAEQVTTVAREVGIEGQLGGQAEVPGAAGTWRDLTDNVNRLAANLTTQVRAIAEVATAVIQGNLTRVIAVEARGEVQALKDTINQMITNLRNTTRTAKEQDWLKTNLARFFGLMQGQRSLQALTDLVMSELTPAIGAQHGAFFVLEKNGEEELRLVSTYAHLHRKQLASRFSLGEGLVGQSALERKPIVVTEVPDDYVRIGSGLGFAPPRNIAVFPVLSEGQVRGVIEVASFHEFTPVQLSFLEQLVLNVGLAINLIGTTTRTEELLQQLKKSNVELEQRRKEIEEKADLLELRNREIADASRSLENKAQELSKASEYKSQFLANMSHEIRTPLNSMLILAQMLAANESDNLTPKQQEWAETIHSAGRDLLALINQILDLAKVEAGRIETLLERCSLADLRAMVERTFRPVAMQRGLGFDITFAADVPAHITTDRRLLEQILRNLLSNAFKFTEHGRVELRVERSRPDVALRSESLRRAAAILAFRVVDTGIGISPEKQRLIFEPFHQGDASVARRYGGTGLGLTIAREYSRVLGGELTLKSTLGSGSTFTLWLPLRPEEVVDGGPPVSAPSLPPSSVTPSPELAPEEAKRLRGKKILVVEDDARNLYSVAGLLENQGVEVLPAASAAEAFASLHAHPDVDLILMDIMMPGVDGYQATRRIRAMKEFSTLPILAFTAKASGTDRDLCLAAGCDGVLVKPAENRKLLAEILRHLRD